MTRKGGAKKTTTTLCLGHPVATRRGDKVVALDGNPDAGNLAERGPRQTTTTFTDLLEERDGITRYADIAAFVNQTASRLEVVAADSDPRIAEALTPCTADRACFQVAPATPRCSALRSRGGRIRTGDSRPPKPVLWPG
jgi:MinD-like ATPase involved in chromosome partitioning or flagellar assembly